MSGLIAYAIAMTLMAMGLWIGLIVTSQDLRRVRGKLRVTEKRREMAAKNNTENLLKHRRLVIAIGNEAENGGYVSDTQRSYEERDRYGDWMRYRR